MVAWEVKPRPPDTVIIWHAFACLDSGKGGEEEGVSFLQYGKAQKTEGVKEDV